MENRKTYKHAVFVDKPSGISTKECLYKILKIYKIKFAGYTGILDPKVSGMVLFLLDDARKAMPLLMGLNKTYEGIMYLHNDVDRNKIEEVCKKFSGKIKQIPPARSRVARKEREREIISLEIQKIEGRNVWMKIECEAGTYIRKLMHDIGQDLGCGAHMKFLRRVSVGGFTEMVKFENLEKNPEKYLVSLENVLEKVGVPKVSVQQTNLEKIKYGQPLNWTEIEKLEEGKHVGIYFENQIIALGTSQKDKVKIDRVFKF